MTRLALHILFILSGAAALGYQLVWSKMFATGLGHEYPAVLAIVCAIMAGMALGAVSIDRLIPRSPRAGLWLAGLELLIGVWAILAAFVLPQANDLALQWMGLAPSATRHWFLAFAVPALVLLPATVAMGATFPAMEKFLSAVAPRHGSVGSVYAANTLGAVAGTLLAPYVLMPALGLTQSCWVLAVLNLAVGIGVFVLWRNSLEGDRSLKNDTGSVTPILATISHRRTCATLFFTGLLGIGYETVGVRVLTQVLEGTVYTYAAVLAVFLGGTAAGAASYHRWWRSSNSRLTLSRLINCTAITCLMGVGVMGLSKEIYDFTRGLGDSPMRVMTAELLTAMAVFAPPTFCMGALFSHLVQLTRNTRGKIGHAVAWNTAGAALAPVVAVLLLPILGTKWSLIAIGVGYAILGLELPRSLLPLVTIAALWIATKCNLQIVDVPNGGRILKFREGVMASVAVVEDADKHRTLRVDNRFQMGGTAGADAEYRQAHIPLLLHPAPTNALFLGLGTGISFGAASLHSNLQADGVELVPEVVEVMPAFAPQNFAPNTQSRLRVHVADARRYVRTTTTSYDVIIADLFHPYRDGAGALYTREHFAAIRQRLNTKGLFCQWLPLHQLDDATLRVITRTFLEVFPEGEAWLLRLNVDVPVVGLIGRNGTQIYSSNWLENRQLELQLANALKRLSLGDSVRFFGSLLADVDDLQRFCASAPVNTDENQHVTFMAPRLNYQRDVKPYASLFSLLRSATPALKTTLHLPVEETPFASRVEGYISARDVYLRGLALYSEGQREKAIEAYIESARLSSEFTAGYAQCLSIVSVLVNSEPARARNILQKLIAAQPDRPVAREMLNRLSPP